MTPIVKICNGINCQITITDLTQDSDEYISETAEELELQAAYSRNSFRYSDTYTINVIKYIKSESEEEIKDVLYTCHYSDLDELHYNLDTDGYYVIYHMILPSIDWYEAETKKEKSVINSDLNIYVTDGTNIYKQTENGLQIVDTELVIEVNTVGTTISRVLLKEFSICHLFDCYLSLCKQIYKNISYKCMSKDNIEDLIFKRDFVWMTINVLKYYVELDQMYEAQRLLTEINYCGGICNEHSMLQSKKSGCGCSR